MDQHLSEVSNAHGETTNPTRNIGQNPRPYLRAGHLRLLHEDVDNTGQGRDHQTHQANAPGNAPAG